MKTSRSPIPTLVHESNVGMRRLSLPDMRNFRRRLEPGGKLGLPDDLKTFAECGAFDHFRQMIMAFSTAAIGSLSRFPYCSRPSRSNARSRRWGRSGRVKREMRDQVIRSSRDPVRRRFVAQSSDQVASWSRPPGEPMFGRFGAQLHKHFRGFRPCPCQLRRYSHAPTAIGERFHRSRLLVLHISRR
jgi:hypothetical protein